MPVQPPPPSGTATRREQAGSWLAGYWTQAKASAPMTLALLVVAAVWVFGAFWSFSEQKAFAAAKGFADTPVLPLVLDGFAIAMALVAYAASLDGRPAVPARLGIVFGVVASAASNGVWAAQRSMVNEVPDWTAVTIAVTVPVTANIAFEVLLAELRRQVQRRRGLPAPVALPSLRLIRLVLAPVSTFREWRDEVLARTAQTYDDPAPSEAPTEDVQPSTAPIPTLSTPLDSAPEPEPAPEPVLRALHVVDTPPIGTVQPAAEPVDEHPDPLLHIGTSRTVPQCRDVARKLGVTRRSASWNKADFNAAIDDHIRKHGPKPAAPKYKEAR